MGVEWGGGKKIEEILDDAVRGGYYCFMNLTERANAMRIANADAKRRIQAKRSNDAKTNATLKNIPHPGKFPSKYKYG